MRSIVQLTHNELNMIASKWLVLKGCSVVISELRTWGTQEIADVIGFTSGESILIESKTSRADFFADMKKPWRKEPSKGMGNYRFIFCEKNLIKKEELLPNWGLLEHDNGKIIHEGRYFFNMGASWQEGFIKGERGLLVSAINRVANKHENIESNLFFRKNYQNKFKK